MIKSKDEIRDLLKKVEIKGCEDNSKSKDNGRGKRS